MPACVAALFAVALCPAQVLFTDVAPMRGISGYMMGTGFGSGIAAADYDADGDTDVFLPTAFGMPDRLYRNDGTGNFQDVAALVGIDSTDPNKVALWFDMDADHDLDLAVIGGDCYSPCGETEQIFRLYRQETPTQFTEVSATAGIVFPAFIESFPHPGGMAAGDINNDGWLDLVVTVWGKKLHLFRNNRDGTFTNIAASAGLDATFSYWQPMLHDFNGDGWQDLFVCIDFQPNRLYINQGDETFLDIAPQAGVAFVMNDMGMALGDYDNDGDLDIHITNIFDYTGQGEHNLLLRNNSVGRAVQFADVTPPALGNGGWGWGCTFIDHDNDGDLDLAATNGYHSTPWLTDPSKFWRNNGQQPTPTWSNVSTAVGFNDTSWGSALVAFDYDRDGDLDMMQSCNLGGPMRLLENQQSGTIANNTWVVFKPRMSGPNHHAIGTIVRILAQGKTQMRLISAGTSFFGQEPAEAFFGVPQGASPTDPVFVDVLVEYPDGTRMARTGVPAGASYTVTLGDLNFSGQVNGIDLAMLLGNWGRCSSSPAPGFCPGDFDGNGAVNGLDLARLLGEWD
jgi:FG-GAP-like repeat/ASPIC and UnbV